MYPLMSMSFTEVGLTAFIKLTALAQPYWEVNRDLKSSIGHIL